LALATDGDRGHDREMGPPDVEVAPSAVSTPDGDGAPERPIRHHRLRWILLGLLGVAVSFLLVSAVLTFEGRARPVGIREAVSHYHPDATGDALPHPAPGVYSYTGTGTDGLSLPPLSQPEGPTLPGTVELGTKGCWTFRIDFSTNHWQSWTYCQGSAGLDETAEQVWQRWMVGPVPVTNLSSLRCDPGSMALPSVRTVGQSWPARCTGTSTEISGRLVAAGSYRFLGDSTMTIGGHKVVAAHFRRQWSLSGAQVGPERDDLWFDTATGLPLENQRSIRVRTDTPFGTSTYTETGHFVLGSLTPLT
jgi:hypothetical protein